MALVIDISNTAPCLIADVILDKMTIATHVLQAFYFEIVGLFSQICQAAGQVAVDSFHVLLVRLKSLDLFSLFAAEFG